jgi:hypothetical protein
MYTRSTTMAEEIALRSPAELVTREDLMRALQAHDFHPIDT